MSEQRSDKHGLVPKLRFPEFRDAGEWDFKPLKDVAKRKTKRNADESIVRVLTNSAEHGVIDQKDYFDKDIAIQGNLESYFVVALGDYVYNPRVSATAPVGPIGKNKIGLGVMSPLYTVFGFDDDEHFYEHFFRSSLWHAHMRLVSNSGARHDRMAISNDDFMAMPVPSPLPAERHKIAECLSSLDALISAQTDKLAALGDHKKGLRQQLFPAEGETTPRLRFPEFRNAGEWVEKQLSSCINLVSGLHLSPEEYAETGEIPYFSGPSDFTNDISRVNKWTNKTANVANENDILIVVKGSGVGDFWRLSVARVAIGRQLMAIKVPTGSSEFLYQSMVAKGGRLKSRASGNLIPGLARPDILEMPLLFPPTEAEQAKVAACLSSVDLLIAAAVDVLAALKAHKNGLMQQLFPSPFEAVA